MKSLLLTCAGTFLAATVVASATTMAYETLDESHIESVDPTSNCTGAEQCKHEDYDIEDMYNYIYPKTHQWLLIGLNIIVFILGLVGNALVCLAVYRNHSMRTVTNYFIVNLAVADLLVIIVCLPPTVVWDITLTWFLGLIPCKIVLYLQVEAALTTDPENEELLKLKIDLEEVIELTQDLVKSQQHKKKVEEKDPEVLAALASKWKVGDPCMAPWSEDGKYYEATIESIVEDGVVNLTFNEYKNKDVAMLSQLKSVAKRPASDLADQKSKKKAACAIAGMDPTKQKEYLKKRKQKKLQRFKELEEERDKEKNKWLTFANKSTRKGVIKKSIFATPENVNGRVGIGTCGVSGKEMTKFTNGEKWRRGA